MASENEFVGALNKSIVQRGMSSLRQAFSTLTVDKAKDPYSQNCLALFSTFSPEQKEIFFEILQQVKIDTVATMLCAIDGATLLDGLDSSEEFILSSDGKQLNGDLHNSFLLLIEDELNK